MKLYKMRTVCIDVPSRCLQVSLIPSLQYRRYNRKESYTLVYKQTL